jgi:hypothetical protein
MSMQEELVATGVVSMADVVDRLGWTVVFSATVAVTGTLGEAVVSKTAVVSSSGTVEGAEGSVLCEVAADVAAVVETGTSVVITVAVGLVGGKVVAGIVHRHRKHPTSSVHSSLWNPGGQRQG